MFKFFCIALLTLSHFALAEETGHIEKADGQATLSIAKSNKTISAKAKTEVHVGDRVTGETGSYVLLQLNGERIAARGPFSFVLQKSTDNPTGILISLISGKLRIQVTHPASDKLIPVLRTEFARILVRGTDFFAAYDSNLGETEAVSFDHELAMVTADRKARVRIKGGQWAGYGGRFGRDLHQAKDITADALDHFKQQIPLGKH